MKKNLIIAGVASLLIAAGGSGIMTGYTGGSPSFGITASAAEVLDISTLSYTINGKAPEEAEITYTGSAIKPTIRFVKPDGTTQLVSATYATVTYENNVDVGTATIHIEGKGTSLSGTRDIQFTISPKTLTSSAISVSSVTYNGTAQTPAVTVKDGTKVIDPSFYTVSYKDNVNVGKGTVSVTFKSGNYTGTIEKTFAINKATLTADDVELSGDTFTYTGDAITVGVKSSQYTITENDYSISYTSNKNAGTATARIVFTGNYSGTVSKKFTINPAAASDVSIAAIGRQVYTGSAVTPAINATYKGVALKAGTDYTVTYSDNVGVGQGTAHIEFKGNFSGSRDVSFTIANPTTSDIVCSFTKGAEYPYTGKAIEPTVTVKLGTTTLKKGVDYTVAYYSNTNVGMGYAVISFQGDYSGTKYLYFSITKGAIRDSVTSVRANYSGGQKPPVDFRVYNTGGYLLAEGVDYTANWGTTNYDITGTGQYITVDIVGIGNYAGSSTQRKVSIQTGKITTDMVTVGTSSYIYDGTEKRPGVLVKNSNGTRLYLNKDYTISYTNCISASNRAKVTVKGIGNYAGSASVYFTINPIEATDNNCKVTVNGGSPAIYMWGLLPSDIVVQVDGKTLTTKDYTIISKSITKNSEGLPTSHAYTVKFKGNYSGTYEGSFEYVTTPFGEGGKIEYQEVLEYNGRKQTPKVVISNKTGVLREGVDYTITFYGECTEAGVYSFSLQGLGQYSTMSYIKRFSISRPLDDAVVLDIPTQNYTGRAVTPRPVVKVGDKTLTYNYDYIVTYTNNTNEGTATAIITGRGAYSGTIRKTFTIINNDVSNANVTLLGQNLWGTFEYTGGKVTPDVIVKIGNKTLAPNIDYTISYTNNVEVGTNAYVLVTGKGSYKGSQKVYFTVSRKLMYEEYESTNPFTFEIRNEKYISGGAHDIVNVKFDSATYKGEPLIEGVDYTIDYFGQRYSTGDTTQISFSPLGMGKFYGYNLIRHVTVYYADIECKAKYADWTRDKNNVIFETPVLRINGEEISPNDYSISYSIGPNGWCTATIYGVKGYNGVATKSFFISNPD